MKIVTKGFRELRKSIGKLENEAKTARQQALNRTATSVLSAGIKKTAKEMGGAPQKKIRAKTKIEKASKSKPVATVKFFDLAIGLENLRLATKIRKVRGKRAYKVTYKGREVESAFKIPEAAGEASKFIFTRYMPGRRKRGKFIRGQSGYRRAWGYTTIQEIDRGGGRSPIYLEMEVRAKARFTVEFERALAQRLRQAGF